MSDEVREMLREGYSKEAIRRLKELRKERGNGGNYRSLLDWTVAQCFAGHKECIRLSEEAGAIIINTNPPENN
jgi:hypothetical protein